jgi:hypothetical protein
MFVSRHSDFDGVLFEGAGFRLRVCREWQVSTAANREVIVDGEHGREHKQHHEEKHDATQTGHVDTRDGMHTTFSARRTRSPGLVRH